MNTVRRIAKDIAVAAVGCNQQSFGFYILIEHGSKSKIVKVLSNLDVDNGDRVEILGVLQKNSGKDHSL